MSGTAVRSDWVGRVIDGRFTLLQWLGGSSRSGVFLTELPGDPRQKVAIKLIPSDTEAEDRLDGWDHSAHLSHAHLVRVFHTGHCEIDGTLLIYAVSEYADEVLSEILPTRALGLEEVKDLLSPVLDALTYIHAQGFVHGRLKPSNILAVGDVLKVSADSLVAVGSPPGYGSDLNIYDAPERDRGELSPASDVWSLGVTLVVAITDRLPHWDRWSASAPVVPESIPEPFARVVRGCLELDPAQRFTTAQVRASLALVAREPDPVAVPEAKISPAATVEAAVQSGIETADESAPLFASKRRESYTPRGPQLRVLIFAIVLIVVILPLALRRSHKSQTSSSGKVQESAPAASAPVEQQKPPAGIAPAQKNEMPHADSSSASPPETPPPGSPAVGGPVIKGEVAQRVMPDVTPAASHTIRGTVRVQLRVNVGSAGNVSSTSFDSAGPSRYFARVAMQAAQQWKFTPAQVNGQPASSVWILQFRFTQDGTDVTPTETTP